VPALPTRYEASLRSAATGVYKEAQNLSGSGGQRRELQEDGRGLHNMCWIKSGGSAGVGTQISCPGKRSCELATVLRAWSVQCAQLIGDPEDADFQCLRTGEKSTQAGA
jgi:hypothetical protein